MGQELKINYGDKQTFTAYLALPKEPLKKAAAIIVLHEIWGLTSHIKNICDRLGKEGYLALAPELISSTGIFEKINPKLFRELQKPEKRHAAQALLRDLMQPIATEQFATNTLAKLKASFNYLSKLQLSNKQIGALGFCFGGTYAFHLAVKLPKLKACVVYYGQSPKPLKNIEKIECPVLAFYGENDIGLITLLPELKANMKRYNKTFDYHIYPKTGHAFFNNTNHQAYNQPAAEDSWQKTLIFLNRTLI